jgi:processive 1,2-diacylglycerol beta-glucosyltransferase
MGFAWRLPDLLSGAASTAHPPRPDTRSVPAFTRSPRLLILSASVGAGHVRAAQALEAACATGEFPGEARHLDVLRFTNRAFRTLYSQGYLELVDKAPDVLGWLYDRLDIPWKSNRLQQAFEQANLAPFVKLLESLRPDWALCTHFLPAGIIAWLRRHRRLHVPQAVVVTDFDVHALWLLRDVEQYFVAREEAAVYLERTGVPAERIRVTGIPVDPVFAVAKDRGDARRRQGLDQTLPTVLLSVGGFGLHGAARILEALLAIRQPVQIVAVAGARDEVRSRLQRVAAGVPPRHRVQVLGFTTVMDELMAAADLLVGKAGGLTSSEALARGLPLLIVNPTPGQEERNSDHLLEAGAAVRCNNLPTIGWKIEQLLAEPGRLARLREAARAAGRPRAALDIVSAMRGLMDGAPTEGLPSRPSESPADGDAPPPVTRRERSRR